MTAVYMNQMFFLKTFFVSQICLHQKMRRNRLLFLNHMQRSFSFFFLKEKIFSHKYFEMTQNCNRRIFHPLASGEGCRKLNSPSSKEFAINPRQNSGEFQQFFSTFPDENIAEARRVNERSVYENIALNALVCRTRQCLHSSTAHSSARPSTSL